MKKVVKGKLYDTEKATLIAEWSWGSPGNFQHVVEGLYKTRNGRYFIAGSGGPMSKYARKVDQNTWSGGSDITPVSRQAAFEWCQENGVDPDLIAREFPDFLQEA